MRSMVEGALWAMFDFYRERVAIGSGAPIVTPTACHFPRLGRGKLIGFQSLPRRSGGGEPCGAWWKGRLGRLMLLYVRKSYAPPVTQSINELKKKVM